jgi:transglutaminase-like putative cysteine protease
LCISQQEAVLKISVGFNLVCECPQPTPMVLMLHTHPERQRDLIAAENIQFASLEPARSYLDCFGNICTRITAPAGTAAFRGQAVVHDHGAPDPVVTDAEEIPVSRLPDDLLVLLMGSRYCETDQLSASAWNMFGGVSPGWTRVQAICDFVHRHIDFSYSNARSTRTALDAYNEQSGVCRDFAHLAIALCRAMNIPARYCTGYLGDIGIPPAPFPMDFSAWFEVYLGGKWHVFDARHNVPRIGRVLMARGRDAADVPLITSFGPHQLSKFEVTTDEIIIANQGAISTR